MKRKKQPINRESLRNDACSFLALKSDDPVLEKLETYRLRQAGYSVTAIAKAFNCSRNNLYTIWEKFEAEGVIAFVDKRWGAAPRKLIPENEKAIIRAKAINPERSDDDLAQEFELDRTTVFRLLKEYGIQDLHRGNDKQSGNSDK